MAQILAIDDDAEILKLIKRALERDGHQVDIQEGITNETHAKAKYADLILLDVMMPGKDGFSWCSEFRNQVDAPILFVTARTSEDDLVHGLGIGADDYIQKPFSIAELRARVQAHLRREKRTHTHTIRIGEICLDLSQQQILIGEDTIPFTKSEYIIAAFLMENAGQVYTKEQIYEKVYGYDGESEETAIVEHIKNIRAKLKRVQSDPIETVWGIGYRWKKERK